MLRPVFAFVVLALTLRAESPPDLSVSSPDGKLRASVVLTPGLAYSVTFNESPLLAPSELGLSIRKIAPPAPQAAGLDFTPLTLGAAPKLLSSETRSADTTWENPFGKRRHVRDHFNELTITLSESNFTYQLIFRAYNDGVAFRYVLPAQPEATSFDLSREHTTFVFPADHTAYCGSHRSNSFRGPQEWEFLPKPLSSIPSNARIGLPVLVTTPTAFVAITESDLLDWAGLWLTGTAPANPALDAKPAAPLPTNAATSEIETSATGNAGLQPGPTSTAAPSSATPLPALHSLLPPIPLTPHASNLTPPPLVSGSLPAQSPWRVLLVGETPGTLIESNLIENLATPSRLADTSWIKPGKMAWDHWWSGDLKMDHATLKQYVDLAADQGWPYMLVDWTWYGPYDTTEADITTPDPKIDLPALLAHAKSRGVRLWLWLHSNDVDRENSRAYERAFALYEQWGIAGVKIDFMDRDDQEMVNWYTRVAESAARHHLMLNLHGAYKPTGLSRTYPHQLTREGILGNEYNKWSTRITPEHKATLPFTRFLAGAADYTPGGFLNVTPEKFRRGKPTQVMGTRAAELALMVVYESPIACLCDHPDHYRDQPGTDFLRIVPTVWDETRVLASAVADYVVIARRSGDTWYLGAITDASPRTLKIPLGFLDKNKPYGARLWTDTPESAAEPTKISVTENTFTATDTLTLELAPAGGFCAILQPAK